MEQKEIDELLKNAQEVGSGSALTSASEEKSEKQGKLFQKYKIKDIVFLAIITACTLVTGAIMPLLVNVPLFGIIQLGLGIQFSLFPVIGMMKVRKPGALLFQSIFISIFLVFMFPPMAMLILCALIAEAVALLIFHSYKNDWACVVAGTLYMPLTIPFLFLYYRAFYTVTGSEKAAVSMFIGGGSANKPNAQAQLNLIFTPVKNANNVIYAYTVMADEKNNSKYIEIPATYQGQPVIGIDDNGFDELKNLETIYLPNSITSIGYEAFYKSSLKEITIPDSVEFIDGRAFAYCASLKKVKLPENSKYTKIEYETFTYCTSLGEIVIPQYITYITTRAFEYAQMESITIGRNVSKIGNQAFNESKIKKGVSIYDLSKWCKITFDSQISSPLFWGHKLFMVNTQEKKVEEIKELVIPEDITELGRFQFGGCTSITSVDMEHVTSIKDEVFINCTQIESFKLNENLPYFTSNFFYNCKSLKEITIPKNISSIPYCCFYNCESLTKVTFLGKINLIGALAFTNCRNLKEIVYPGTEYDWSQIRKRDGRMWQIGMGNFNIKLNDATIDSKKDLSDYSNYAPGEEGTYTSPLTPDTDNTEDRNSGSDSNTESDSEDDTGSENEFESETENQ